MWSDPSKNKKEVSICPHRLGRCVRVHGHPKLELVSRQWSVTASDWLNGGDGFAEISWIRGSSQARPSTLGPIQSCDLPVFRCFEHLAYRGLDD